MTQPPTDPEGGFPSPRPSNRPPVWSWFLTPLAVLVGAAAIVVTIVLLDDDPQPAEPVGPALEAVATAVESLAAAAESLEVAAAPSTPAGPVTLGSVLDGYAASLDLDADQFGECLRAAANYEAVGDQLQRGVDLGVNGTPAFFINNKFISGAQPAWVFAEVIAAELAGSPTSIDEYSEGVASLAAREPPAFAIIEGRPDITGAPIKGSPDAAVVIVEFSDFQCPFCLRWYNDTLPEIENQFGDEVALVFLHFPIAQLHPNAPTVHVAASCAGEQGKFWEMHDLLFERQSQWANLPNTN